MTDATELAQALASKADKTELQNVDKKFENYTTTENMNTLLAGKQDVIPENTYDAMALLLLHNLLLRLRLLNWQLLLKKLLLATLTES